MTSSSSSPFRQLFRTSGQLVYGKNHPLSYNAGGEPSGIRTMQPSDIRGFHDANYFLKNMGTIVALPPDVSVVEARTHTDATLNVLQQSSTNSIDGSPEGSWSSIAIFPSSSTRRRSSAFATPARPGWITSWRWRKPVRSGSR